jgi:toxin-antitoxin system PIN domain toxin
VTSFDTNIVVHSANGDSPHHAAAREFLEEAASRRDIAIAELMLVEVFLKLCSAKIFRHPMSPAEASRYCQTLRNNRNWRLVESAPVMDDVWTWTQRSNFAFRRIIDVRLGLTLRHAGVNEFATSNPKDFQGLGFRKIWNPLNAEH